MGLGLRDGFRSRKASLVAQRHAVAPITAWKSLSELGFGRRLEAPALTGGKNDVMAESSLC
jgi:hypothetical protein